MTALVDIHEQAKGRWRALLPRFDVPTKSLDGKQHPCPSCGGKDRFRFDDKEGRGTWICNVCGAGNGVTMVMRLTGLPFVEAARRIREHLPECPTGPTRPPRNEARCRERSRLLWMTGAPVQGAEQYLRARDCWSPVVQRCPDLRFVPNLEPASCAPEQYAKPLPALLALVRDPRGEPVSVHRTYIARGRRAYRAMMPGSVPAGSAIRIMPAIERLGVAEGLETAIRAAARFDVPCWSLISAGNLSKFTPPAGVGELSIFGDADCKFGGQAASFALAHRVSCARSPIACTVHIPEALGTDWADEPAPMREFAQGD